MKICICGEQAEFYCRPCLTAVCNTHKLVHEEEKERIHVFETVRERLPTEKIHKIVESLALKIKVAEKCKNQILEETERFIAKIKDMCTQSLENIEKKQDYYSNLLKICRQQLFDDQMQVIEKELRYTLMINMPIRLFKEIEIWYTSDFLVDHQDITCIDSMLVDDAKDMLQRGYGVFLECHTDITNAIAITNDSKYIVTGGDTTIRIWSLHDKTQKVIIQCHQHIALCVAITSDNNYIVSGGIDKNVIIWSLQDKKQVAVLHGHKKAVKFVVINNDDKYIISSDFWDVII